MRKKCSKCLSVILLLGVMLLNTLSVSAAEFPDVSPNAWFYNAVTWASEQGIMTGYSDGNFGPGDNVTRGQFATILYRQENSPSTNFEYGIYSDVTEGSFYSIPAIWCYYSKAMTGYEGGRFGPNDAITREQVATILYRYAVSKKYATAVYGDLYAYPDGRNVSTFAQAGVRWAIGNGLITGDQGTINPQGKASRAQIATIIKRFIEWLPANSNLSVFEIMPTGFDFSSGAGGWGTHIDIQADGSFAGVYHDSDMGDRGNGYPNGTVYICEFNGSFSEPTQLNNYAYSMNLEHLELEGTPGDVYYENNTRYIYSEPYGLENADEILIYIPGTPFSELPAEFVSWLHAFIDTQKNNQLPYYGLYNVNEKLGFAGYY